MRDKKKVDFLKNIFSLTGIAEEGHYILKQNLMLKVCLSHNEVVSQDQRRWDQTLKAGCRVFENESESRMLLF